MIQQKSLEYLKKFHVYFSLLFLKHWQEFPFSTVMPAIIVELKIIEKMFAISRKRLSFTLRPQDFTHHSLACNTCCCSDAEPRSYTCNLSERERMNQKSVIKYKVEKSFFLLIAEVEVYHLNEREKNFPRCETSTRGSMIFRQRKDWLKTFLKLMFA